MQIWRCSHFKSWGGEQHALSDLKDVLDLISWKILTCDSSTDSTEQYQKEQNKNRTSWNQKLCLNAQHLAHQKEVNQNLPTYEGDMRWPTCVYQRTGALKAAGDAHVQHPRSQVISTPKDEKNKEDLEDEKKGVEQESKSLLWNYKV